MRGEVRGVLILVDHSEDVGFFSERYGVWVEEKSDLTWVVTSSLSGEEQTMW